LALSEAHDASPADPESDPVEDFDGLVLELEADTRTLLARTLRLWRRVDVAAPERVREWIASREEALTALRTVVCRFEGCGREIRALLDPDHPRSESRGRAMARVRCMFQRLSTLDREIELHLTARRDDIQERMMSTGRARRLARQYGPFSSGPQHPPPAEAG
jgi:hypothetical protein